MIAIPLIYFSLLSIWIYRRNKDFDIALIASLVYAVSGFFAILIDSFNLRHPDVANYTISYEASTAYCGLLTLCLIPLIFNSHLKITNIRPISNERLLRFLAWFAFSWFLISTAFSWQSIMNILTGDMAQYRANLYEGWGQEYWTLQFPRPIQFVLGIIFSFFGCQWTLIFLAFFSLCIQKLEKKYFYLFLIASLSGPITGIIGADRSKTAYWIMSIIAMYIVFRPLMDQTLKKKIVMLGFFIICILSVYLAAMTIARFGDKSYDGVSGSQGGLIYYFGQSFVNFCYYYDNYEPPFMHLGIIFPFFFERVLGIPSGGVVIQQSMTDATGLWTGVFYTFIGLIIVGAGKTIATLYCIVYTSISSFSLRRICRLNEAYASSLYLYFAFASVVYLGLFGHYYSSSTVTFGVITMYIMVRIMEKTH